MNARLHFRTMICSAAISMLVVLMAGCVPATGLSASTATLPMVQASVLTEDATPDTGMVGVTPVVTPRGPNLVASEPSTVRLASGKLQLVEFYRFT